MHRVENKLKDWKNMTLSQEGKLKLIKFMARAIQTYLMSCFKIPQGVVDKIQPKIIRFWWGQKGEERRTHWTKWEELCRPKGERSLGLREIEAFNKSLLTK